ncbi:MAG: metallophosphoesterase family protein [Cyclobacteriaceae bacterium]
MVKIGLLSDSHGSIEKPALEALSDVDEIWHAGDVGDAAVLEAFPKGKKKRVVFGNIDDSHLRMALEEELFFEAAGLKVLMTHIGGKPPRYAKGIKKRIMTLKPQLFICGHSHICKVEFDKTLNCLYMNPGAIGNQGFHLVKTLLKFEINEGKIQNLNVVELGRRGRK